MLVVLGMLFLTFSNANVPFAEKELTRRIYITKEILPTNRQVEIFDQKKFAKTAFNKNFEAFVLHVSSLKSRMSIHPARNAQLALLLTQKVTVLTKYSDFVDVFLKKLANVFSEQTGSNKHAIKLEKGKQPAYGPTYSLKQVELETFKNYIKINLVNGFI